MRNNEPNEISRELLGVSGLNPWVGHVASPRIQMWGSHISQTLVVDGSTERYCQTGMEREYGKYTFSIKVPGDPARNDGIEIIKVLERYPNKIGYGSISLNPQTMVIYQDINSKEIGIINIPNYCSNHPYFGFNYKGTSALNEVRKGAFLAAGTILADSPNITPNGGYKYGIQCNMAFMTHPSVSEDSVMVSRSALKKLTYHTFEVRTVEWGSKSFALNLYGNENNHKPFPDIGEYIRDDGLLMCLRSYDKNLAAVEQSINDVREPDFIFDKLTYAGGAGGRVIDIKIQRNIQNPNSDYTGPMDAQAEKYDMATRDFYSEIVKTYNILKKDYGDALRLTPEFHRTVVEALSMTDNEQHRISKLFRNTPIDDYRVEFVIEYTIVPGIGNKISDTHGIYQLNPMNSLTILKTLV